MTRLMKVLISLAETPSSTTPQCRQGKVTGVLLTPGSTMDMEGWSRTGYANDPEILRQDLEKVSGSLEAKT
jgi:hypothetical protein